MHGVSLKCLLLSASPFQTVDVGYVPNDRMQGVFMSSPQARALHLDLVQGWEFALSLFTLPLKIAFLKEQP